MLATRRPMILYAERLSKKSTAFRNFARGINSTATLSGYVNYLITFMKFHNLGEDYDSLVKLSTAEIDKLIIDYLDHLIAREVKGVTQRCHLMGIERMFLMNDCIWHKDRIRKGIKTDDAIPGGTVPITTEELHLMLQNTKSLRTQCIIHFLADTGMRPGGLSDPILRMKHLEEMKTPDGEKCYSLKIYDGSKSGYYAFLTPEATADMDRYFQKRIIQGETFTQESPIFAMVRNSKIFAESITHDYARFIVYNMITQAGIKRIKVSKHRFDKSAMYMFRKRFNTILKLNNEVNSNIAEKLMAHKRGLDGTYLQPTKEECFAEFVKAIPDLTIDPTKRQQLDINEKQKEINLLEQKSRKIDDLEKMVIEMRNKNNVEPTPEMIEIVTKILKSKNLV
jgi:integrase